MEKTEATLESNPEVRQVKCQWGQSCPPSLLPGNSHPRRKCLPALSLQGGSQAEKRQDDLSVFSRLLSVGAERKEAMLGMFSCFFLTLTYGHVGQLSLVLCCHGSSHLCCMKSSQSRDKFLLPDLRDVARDRSRMHRFGWLVKAHAFTLTLPCLSALRFIFPQIILWCSYWHFSKISLFSKP